jgi:hypothetical protein
METGLRAHDDDPRVPVLNNRHGRKRPRYATGFQARRLTVFSSFPIFCRLLRKGFPRLLMPSSLALPPVDHCRGTNPSQAANSRPFLKAAPFPIADTTAVETNGPTPGICCNRTQLGSLLVAAGKSDSEGAVVMAAAKSLIQLGEDKGYEVYYAVLTGQRKSGESLIGSQEKELHQLLGNPKEMEGMAFEQGIGFVPYGGIGLQVYKTVHENEEKEPIIKATALRILALDPDPRTGKALVAATTDKNSLIRMGSLRRPGPARRPCLVARHSGRSER